MAESDARASVSGCGIRRSRRRTLPYHPRYVGI
jgi:hypothetical protein